MNYSISQNEALAAYDAPTKVYTHRKEIRSLWQLFISWAAGQDKENHIGWVGFSVVAMAAIFFPVTMCVILINGAAFGLILTAMFPLALVVTTNLAAMSTKYTIPFLFLSIVISIGVAVASFFI